jgi:hypothetical protein
VNEQHDNQNAQSATQDVTAAATTIPTRKSEELLLILRVRLIFSEGFWKNSVTYVIDALRVFDLQEGMVMSQTLFTVSAVVEVLADSALITDANNRSHAAADTDYLVDTWFGHMKILGLFNTLNRSLKDLSKDILGLVLKLRLIKVLEGFQADSLATNVLLSLFVESLLDWLEGRVYNPLIYKLKWLGLHQDRFVVVGER